MPIDCTPNAIALASKCYCGFSRTESDAAAIWSLCQWASNLEPPVDVFSYEPETEIISWHDSGGNHAGDLAAFNAITSVTGINTVTSINFGGDPITSISNINLLVGLTFLDAIGTNISSIDVSGLVLLHDLHLDTCPNLTSIVGLTTCVSLDTLRCQQCNITGTLDCTGLASLTNLFCYTNPNLTTLTITGCSSLFDVECYGCSIGGTLDFTASAATLTTLNCSSNGALTTVTLTGCASLTTLACLSNASLTTLTLTGCTALTTLDASFCPALTGITGDSTCTSLTGVKIDNSGITSLTLGGAANMSYIEMTFCPITSFIANSLQNVSGDILMDVTSLTIISLPNLATVGNQLALTTTPFAGTLSFPALTSVGSPQTDFVGNASLVVFDAQNLVTMPAGVSFSNCTSLTDAKLNSYLPTALTNVGFFNCALTTTYIDLILARCVASAGWGFTGEIVDLSGGTNLSHALWSAAALADETTLVGRGSPATVVSNP